MMINFSAWLMGVMMLLSLSKKLDINGMSIISLIKYNFKDRVFTLMLVYQKKAMSLDEFSRMLKYLHAANSVYVHKGDFNYDLLKVSTNKLLNHMIGYTKLHMSQGKYLDPK